MLYSFVLKFYPRCHSDPEQKSLGYYPDLELSVVWIVFERPALKMAVNQLEDVVQRWVENL